jgi:hypothetical protein
MHAIRQLSRTSTPLFRTSPSTAFFTRRTMASNSTAPAAPLQEWFVICPDFEGALDKRLAVRPDHIGGLKQDRDDFWLWGGTLSCYSHL